MMWQSFLFVMGIGMVDATWSWGVPSFQGKWYCAQGVNTPLRYDGTNVQCMSTDGATCKWEADRAACQSTAASPPGGLKPLTCGAAHAARYKITGYGVPGHWCQIGLNALAPTSTSCPSVAGYAVTRDVGIWGNDVRSLSAPVTASITAVSCSYFSNGACKAFGWSSAGGGWLKYSKDSAVPIRGWCFYTKVNAANSGRRTDSEEETTAATFGVEDASSQAPSTHSNGSGNVVLYSLVGLAVPCIVALYVGYRYWSRRAVQQDAPCSDLPSGDPEAVAVEMAVPAVVAQGAEPCALLPLPLVESEAPCAESEQLCAGIPVEEGML